MRQFIELIEATAENIDKLDSSAFIYLPPKEPADEFAQCKTCIMFKPKSERCGIFRSSDHVTAEQSCGLYLHGKPDETQTCLGTITPEQAGLVTGPVRCKNCSWYDNKKCGLYKLLNEKLPDVFNLKEKVDQNGCCNAWSKK